MTKKSVGWSIYQVKPREQYRAAREAAWLKGLKRYVGKPCKKHGLCERYVSTSNCVLCTAAALHVWRAADPERVRALGRASFARDPERRRISRRKHRAKDPELHNARTQRWREANPDAVERYSREYRLAHPEKYRVQARVRKARKKRARPLLDAAQKKAIREFYAEAERRGLTVDHDIPLAGCRICGAVGLHVLANLRMMTVADNSAKQNRCGDCWASIMAAREAA